MNKEKFIKGQWYKHLIHNFYFQFDRLEKHKVYIYDHIIEDNLYVKYNVIDEERYLLFRDFDMVDVYFSDIVDYLPSNHPDKIVYLRKKKIKMLCNITN